MKTEKLGSALFISGWECDFVAVGGSKAHLCLVLRQTGDVPARIKPGMKNVETVGISKGRLVCR